MIDPVSGVASTTVLSPTKIAADPPLTAHGIDQAQELGAYLMSLDPPIEAVYSSPYYRCLQTISPFISLRNEEASKRQGEGQEPLPALAIRSETGIGEFYGQAPFDQPRPASHSLLKTMFPLLDESFESGVVANKNGESIEALYSRVAAALEKVVERCNAEGVRSVILCSHAAVIIAIGRVLTGDIPDRVEVQDFDTFTCGLSVFRKRLDGPVSSSLGLASSALPLDERAKSQATATTQPHALALGCSDGLQGGGVTGGWTCEANSDCSFLTGGPERGWYVSLNKDIFRSFSLPAHPPFQGIFSKHRSVSRRHALN